MVFNFLCIWKSSICTEYNHGTGSSHLPVMIQDPKFKTHLRFLWLMMDPLLKQSKDTAICSWKKPCHNYCGTSTFLSPSSEAVQRRRHQAWPQKDLGIFWQLKNWRMLCPPGESMSVSDYPFERCGSDVIWFTRWHDECTWYLHIWCKRVQIHFKISEHPLDPPLCFEFGQFKTQPLIPTTCSQGEA